MTTQRISTTEKPRLDQDEQTTPSNIRPAVPFSVIAKLLGFTFAMITLPIGTYFFTWQYVWRGSSTLAGASAAAVANIVLMAYVLVAMKDDQSDRLEEEQKENKKSR